MFRNLLPLFTYPASDLLLRYWIYFNVRRQASIPIKNSIVLLLSPIKLNQRKVKKYKLAYLQSELKSK